MVGLMARKLLHGLLKRGVGVKEGLGGRKGGVETGEGVDEGGKGGV